MDHLNYYRRRADEETAAAEHATCAQAAEAHRVMAERYRRMCGEAEAAADSKAVQLPLGRGRRAASAEVATSQPGVAN